MKSVFTLLASTLLFAACNPTKPVKTMQAFQAWEYNIASFEDSQLADSLEVMGRNGWEIISARRYVGDQRAGYEFIIKRPLM